MPINVPPLKGIMDNTKRDKFLVFYDKSYQICYYWNDYYDYPQYYDELEGTHKSLVRRMNRELLEL